MAGIRVTALALLAALSAPAPGLAEADGFRHWRALRDAGVVRQQRDFSCGVAALATLLTHYFGDPVDEEVLLAALFERAGDEAERRALLARGVSLADLAALAGQRGLVARGVSIPAASLGRLRVPAIAYLEVAGAAHFTVLRGVGARAVQLADPSWGNVRWPRGRFGAAFSDESGRGKLLLLATAGEVERDYVGIDRPLPLLAPPPR